MCLSDYKSISTALQTYIRSDSSHSPHYLLEEYLGASLSKSEFGTNYNILTHIICTFSSDSTGCCTLARVLRISEQL